ncbi:HDOD domain-containing protein [Helicobacter sp. faydin-H76]|uniref:HDOD domain-containing protein n=1 Tax=Helicobacter cappadocius TaxID=3063998 RepID=A0AA90T5T5_9HELI|nr:HDOD domain-containing protein [Helicobacter sp. faydin-H76]MDP2539843.1 HDOD domain-containing protein [Helicobacter sp. faydin-H76]
MLNKEHCSTLGLAHAILQDPGLSAKILRVVNSVAYGARGEPVSTISRAIVLIGFECVREIATGLLLIQHLTRGKPNNQVVHDNLRRAPQESADRQ